MKKRVLLTISLVVILLSSTTGGLAQGSTTSQANPAVLPEHVPGEMLVKFRPWVNAAQAAQKMDAMDLEPVNEIRPLGVQLVKLPPGLSVERALERYSRMPEVAYAEANLILSVQVPASVTVDEFDQWALEKIQATPTSAWAEFDTNPASPLLAVVDTGITPDHPDLAANMWINSGEWGDDASGNPKSTNGIDDDGNNFVDDWQGWNFVASNNQPIDDQMHGTAVSSVIAAAQNGTGITGVCPWCQLVGVKVLDSSGSGTLANVANGIIYAADLGAKAINLSLGATAGSQTLADAVTYAWNVKGAVVSAAAGNNGQEILFYPAAYEHAMAVASTNEGDFRSCFSNYYADFISVAAPGEAVIVADINDTEDGYGYFSGTSLAAPHVTGLAGLLFSKYPGYTNVDVRSLIEDSAEDLGSSGYDDYFGHGRINAFRAVREETTPTTPPSGMFANDPSVTGLPHARKLARGKGNTLHMVWHDKDGGQYRVRYATSTDDGASWSTPQTIFESSAETYHPALAVDSGKVYVAFPSLHNSTAYQTWFTSKSLVGGSWAAAEPVIAGSSDAVRPDLFLDPSNGRLHLVASTDVTGGGTLPQCRNNAPFVYYTWSGDQGATWAAVGTVSAPSGAKCTRYADVHAAGENIYIASRSIEWTLMGILPHYRLFTVRSTNGGSSWDSMVEHAGHDALFTDAYGVSLAGPTNQVYLSYEHNGGIYFRSSSDGASWNPATNLGAGRWPSLTNSGGGQAWLMWDAAGEIQSRHFDGISWQPLEKLGNGSYPNYKLGISGNRLEWVSTQQCGPFLLGTSSQPIPLMPAAFNGTVLVDGSPVAEGTLVSAWIDGTKYAEASTNTTNYSLVIPADDAATPEKEGGAEGDAVQFHIGGTIADQSGTWYGGVSKELHLTASTSSGAPLADFSASPLSGEAPLQVAFSDLSTGSINSWTWDFGDGGTSTYQDPLYTYLDEGIYTVSLTVSGPGGTTTESKVGYISITAANNPPIAYDQTVTTDEDTPVSITLTASDAEVDPLSYLVVSGPSNGSLDGTAPNLTYTPNLNSSGEDSFTFMANDGQDDSNEATVTIQVTAVNDPPTADDQQVSTLEDTPVSVTLTASDVDDSSLSFTVVTGPSNGSLAGTAPNLTYTPNVDFFGHDSFTFMANDGKDYSNEATVTIQVTAVNDPPTADDQQVSTLEDTPVSVTLTASDVDDSSLSFTVVTGPFNGSLAGTAPNLTYTPNVDFFGQDSFTFEANDGQEDSNTATVTIQVTAVNDPPTADDQQVSTLEDTPVSVTLTASDVDDTSLSFTVMTGPANGSLGGTAPNLTYTPNPNYYGDDSFTFKANDGQEDSNTATVEITVNAAPIMVDTVASGEIPVAGTVSGDYTNTFEDNAPHETITERDSGGKPASRYSFLEHKWLFQVTPGNAVTFYANVWSDVSPDGDSFEFAFSSDDLTYTEMFTVTANSDSGYETFVLPSSIQGTLYIRVKDSDQTPGNRSQDTLYVDHLFVRSESQPGDPPAAPTGLQAAAVSPWQIDLTWSSTAEDAWGFYVERSLNGSDWEEIATVAENVTSFSNTDLVPGTTYSYRVRAYNASGTSSYSNVASATTSEGIFLTAALFKERGLYVVELNWSGSTATSFDIYRNGSLLQDNWPFSSYRDETYLKKGGNFEYQVCDAGSTVNCSNIVAIDF